ncbi:zinc finger c-x8-C-x5-C-x3-H type (and similar) domain-containing protein [Hirsutella rhossiliensis]|uniref:Zinc finger c-x8-C-x5-C-x3-H type (And similar) domain-containing protein n=1 Tax=Hirsutella rhossiliensis TaxID=111463 RepID=A0A9P8MV09_9HYPO|nr:zinc finger c-x8-C-x5-C-x3-H type (and similar) domain-containing protein [Hirsutella rhossiliensis]KAH0960944.1 zinc finger c-x8-C-x5-C-x3-H type (and similar) domain-containing protein [Hirsutella rhossiliensis]
MSDEDKELLARIGQLAGQINRHKNQQAGAAPSNHPAPYRRNAYRHASAPYPRAGYRGGRPPVAHRHRTLQLSTPRSGSESGGASDSAPSGNRNWVSRTDRHRQLINADIYEKEVQSRTKAIEETRQRKLRLQKSGEKARFNAFLRRQANPPNPSAVPTNAGIGAGRNEILIDGMRFRVVDGGKKLVKAMEDIHSTPSTPKSAIVAGVTFYRTKTGNLVANRVVQDHRRTGVVKKKNELCRIFSTTGSCPKGPACRFQHDPAKVTMCRDFLKEGKCADGESCDLSHEPSPERVPNCVHFAKGNCAKPDCPYAHSQAAPGAPVCEAFGFCGYCEKGASCTERHVFECPDFSNTGSCKTKGCKLLHRERASVLRAHFKRGEPEGDVSSEDEADDSDDIDSDEVAELIEAKSDDSDFDDDNKDFLPI